jgi:hypothetical protein
MDSTIAESVNDTINMDSSIAGSVKTIVLIFMIRGERSFFVLYYIGGIIDKHCLILFFIANSFK